MKVLDLEVATKNFIECKWLYREGKCSSDELNLARAALRKSREYHKANRPEPEGYVVQPEAFAASVSSGLGK